MQERKTSADADAKVLADLSALADGSLDPRRAPVISELIAGSPDLRERYERECRAVAALHELRSDRAPSHLRLAIDARQAVPKQRWRPLFAGALATGVAAAVALIVLLLPNGSPGAPSVSQAAELALRGPALPAPLPGPGAKLRQDVQEVYFPNWKGFGWRASGRRIDRLDGHKAVTVYYNHGSTQVAYTILAAPPLHRPGSPMQHMSGINLQSLSQHGRLVVTWRRAGHTCLLSGSGVTVAQLAKLAGWEVPGLEG